MRTSRQGWDDVNRDNFNSSLRTLGRQNVLKKMDRENICLRPDVTTETATREKRDHLKVRKQMGNKVDTCNIQAVLTTCVRSHEQVEVFLSTLINSTSVKHLCLFTSELYASALILTIPKKILRGILYQKIS